MYSAKVITGDYKPKLIATILSIRLPSQQYIGPTVPSRLDGLMR